jgi:ubiquinone/menaquinone biosynthesis C-methylase UbiE
MISKILPFMRCPRCLGTDLRAIDGRISCRSCTTQYPVKNGILDLLGNDPDEIITPFQRLMQTPPVVSIYEKLWRRAGYYLASSRSFKHEMQTVLRIRKGKSADRTLDLACGTGVFTRPLARIGDNPVVGLDLSWPMLNQAQKLLKREGLSNVVFIRATAFSLPFVDAAFSYVNCCGALHLFDRPDAALREIGRILEPGGHLCVQTTIRPARSAGFAYFLERFIRFGFFEEPALSEQLQLAGFSIVESERHRISFTFLARRGEM